MKHIYKILLLSFLVLWNGCSNKHKNNAEFPPLEELTADSIIIPPVLLSVTRLFIANNMLVAYEQRKDTMFSFWRLPECKYLFSVGCRGEGPNDFLMLDRTFVETNNGFKTFEIASNKVKEISIDSTGHFNVKASKQLNTDQRGLNRFLFLADSTYCFVSDKEESEYALLDNKGNIQYFSNYPKDLLLKEKDEINRFVYNKLTIANPSGDKFAAFYAYTKLCRIYDNKGRMLHETLLSSPSYSNSEDREIVYQYFPCADENHIYILSTKKPDKRVLEIWNWEGMPVAYYLLDKNIQNIAIASQYNKIYAVDNKQEGVIYTYNIPDKNKSNK